MDNQTFYKLASFSLGIFSIILVFLILSPFAESFYSKKKDMTFEDELRIHRQYFLQISNSKNPLVSDRMKILCRQEVNEIDAYLYSDGEEFTHQDELRMREKIKAINSEIKNNSYYSSGLFYRKNRAIEI